MPINTLKDNKTTRVLEDAEKSGYGVIAAIVWNSTLSFFSLYIVVPSIDRCGAEHLIVKHI